MSIQDGYDPARQAELIKLYDKKGQLILEGNNSPFQFKNNLSQTYTL